MLKTIFSIGLAMATLLLHLPCIASPPPEPNYQPDPVIISQLHEIGRPVEIVVFHGTWCQDCQREMPRFNLILQQANNPHFTVKEFEVNPQKQDVLGKFKEYGIKKVPSFIFFYQGRELGRVVEKPEKSLEEDFLKILQKI